jgi:hypothetical protein
MQVIARMNLGGPAVPVADLMRNFDPGEVNPVLVTGYCDENEADYLDEVARDVVAIRLPGFGRSISIVRDLNAFLLLIREIRKFKPNVIHTHTAKAGVLGRLAGLIAAPQAKRVHTFHGHLLHGYFGVGKTRIVIIVERFLARKTHRLVAIGNKVKNDLLEVGIGNESQYEVIFPGLQPLASRHCRAGRGRRGRGRLVSLRRRRSAGGRHRQGGRLGLATPTDASLGEQPGRVQMPTATKISGRMGRSRWQALAGRWFLADGGSADFRSADCGSATPASSPCRAASIAGVRCTTPTLTRA